MPGTCARCGKRVWLRVGEVETVGMHYPATLPVAWVNKNGTPHAHRRAA